MGGGAGTGIGRVYKVGYLDGYVTLRDTLAHQELALIGLEVFPARRLAPGIVNFSFDEFGFAGAAGAGSTFVWEIDSLAQSREENFLAMRRVELVRTIAGIDLGAHAFGRF